MNSVAAQSSLSRQGPQKSTPVKTPIQILHEYGIKCGSLPVYVLEKAEGEAHQPSFVISVTFKEASGTGQGPSKRVARQRAAEAALKSLQIDVGAAKVTAKSDSNGVPAENNSTPNSVGKLQELALHRGWRLPDFVVSAEAGPPHMREFTVTCRLEDLTETGAGSSKKAARKVAAEKMMAKLHSLSGSSEITWTPKPSVKLDSLRNATSEKICALRRSPLSVPNADYIQVLLDLSKEQGFEVTYFDIDELTVNGQYQCLVELSTSPVAVCHGTGLSCSNAHNDAAHSALQYLKIMASIK